MVYLLAKRVARIAAVGLFKGRGAMLLLDDALCARLSKGELRRAKSIDQSDKPVAREDFDGSFDFVLAPVDVSPWREAGSSGDFPGE